jgi:TRAP-type transport system small permease protein
LEKYFLKFDSILIKFCVFILGIMGVLVILSVILRYIFGISYIWLAELITCLFVITVFFGAAIAIKREEHIKIDFFIKKIPEKVQNIISIIIEIMIISIQIQVIKSSLHWITKVGSTPIPGLYIPSKYIYLILPLGAMFIIFNNFRRLYKYFTTLQKN